MVRSDIGSFGMEFDDPLDEIVQSGRAAMQSMFRTVDALDYSLIASVDVKHRIEQLAVDRRGLRLALVEKLGDKNVDESLSQCRIYSIGQKRVIFFEKTYIFFSAFKVEVSN